TSRIATTATAISPPRFIEALLSPRSPGPFARDRSHLLRCRRLRGYQLPPPPPPPLAPPPKPPNEAPPPPPKPPPKPPPNPPPPPGPRYQPRRVRPRPRARFEIAKNTISAIHHTGNPPRRDPRRS